MAAYVSLCLFPPHLLECSSVFWSRQPHIKTNRPCHSCFEAARSTLLLHPCHCTLKPPGITHRATQGLQAPSTRVSGAVLLVCMPSRVEYPEGRGEEGKGSGDMHPHNTGLACGVHCWRLLLHYLDVAANVCARMCACVRAVSAEHMRHMFDVQLLAVHAHQSGGCAQREHHAQPRPHHDAPSLPH